MRKVLIPKKDYVKELIKIIRVTKDEQKLRNLLSDYCEFPYKSRVMAT